MKEVRRIGVVVVVGIWLCIALIMSIQLYLRFTYEGQSPSFGVLLLIQVLAWSVWMACTPVIIRLGKRFRLGRATWKTGMLFHLPFSILFVLAFLVCYVSIFLLINPMEFNLPNFKSFYLTFYFQIFQWCWLIYWAVLGISYAVEYYDKYRDRELKAAQLEQSLSVAQLQALQMQLQPHFLFNTLHTIAAKVRLDEKQSAIKMLSLLSKLLRKVLQTSSSPMMSLADEIKFLEEYLKLEQTRFENRLQIQFVIEEAAKNRQVPSMILQPLIENAMKHGFSKKLDAQILRIEAKLSDQFLELSVYNDGPSYRNNEEESSGIGLVNTQKRLEQLYGDTAKFTIENKENGVKATINLPLQHEH